MLSGYKRHIKAGEIPWVSLLKFNSLFKIGQNKTQKSSVYCFVLWNELLSDCQAIWVSILKCPLQREKRKAKMHSCFTGWVHEAVREILSRSSIDCFLQQYTPKTSDTWNSESVTHRDSRQEHRSMLNAPSACYHWLFSLKHRPQLRTMGISLVLQPFGHVPHTGWKNRRSMWCG